MKERRYFEQVAKENRFVRELLALVDVANKFDLDNTAANDTLILAVNSWEAKYPRLSALYKERTMA